MPFIYCSHCQGQADRCEFCRGWRLALPVSHRRALVWRGSFSLASIFWRRFWKIIIQIIDGVLALTIATLLVGAIFFVFSNQTQFFYLLPNFFGPALLFCLYFYVRFFWEGKKIKKLEPLWETVDYVINDNEIIQEEVWNQKGWHKIDVNKSLEPETKKILDDSFLFAKKQNQALHPLHVLYQLSFASDAKHFLIRLEIRLDVWQKRLQKSLELLSRGQGVSGETQELMLLAGHLSQIKKETTVGWEEILEASLSLGGLTRDLLFGLGLDEKTCHELSAWAESQRAAAKLFSNWQRNFSLAEKKSNFLFKSYPSKDLGKLARTGGFGLLHSPEKYLEAIKKQINLGYNSFLVFGAKGVGKTSFLASLSLLSWNKKLSPEFNSRRFWLFKSKYFLSGKKGKENFNNKKIEIFFAAAKRKQAVIIFDNQKFLKNLLHPDLALVIKLAEKNKVPIFLLLDLESQELPPSADLSSFATEYKFSVLEIKPFSEEEILPIIFSHLPFLEAKYDCAFSLRALKAVISQTAKKNNGKILPASVIADLKKNAKELGQNGWNSKKMIDYQKIISLNG